MDDNFFKLPFIQSAQGPLATFVTIIAVGVMVYDRLNKLMSARKRARDAGGKEKADRFEVISEAEARLREAYESRDAEMRKEIKELKAENEVLRGQLSETKDALAEAQRELKVAQKSIEELQAKLTEIMASVKKKLES